MTDETLPPQTAETTTPAPETPPQPDSAADLQREIAELREQVAESNRTAQFWAQQARNATPTQPGEPEEEPPPEPDEDDTDVLEAITTKGTKGFDALAAKRGFIKRSEVAEMIEARATVLGKEQELMERYPDLRNRTSEFFKSTAGHYGALIKRGVRAQEAMEIAAEKTELDFMRSGKLPIDSSSDKGSRKSDRQARIDAQGSGAGPRRPAGAETDDDTLDDDQKRIIAGMGITPEAYLKRAKAGVRLGGRNGTR